MKFPLAMNLNPTTMARVITDLVESLESGQRALALAVLSSEDEEAEDSAEEPLEAIQR